MNETFNVKPTKFRHQGRSAPSTTVCGLVCLVWAMTILGGCAEEALDFTEVKRIDERVSESELRTFIRIVEGLPDKKLPALPPVFAPPPRWNRARTFPIKELVNEEKIRIDEHWTVDWLARQLPRSRMLEQRLRMERMTREQFVSLAVAIGVALSAATLREEQDLDLVIDRGERAIEKLRADNNPFNSLNEEGMHYVLQQAVWITRVDRAKHLRLVPPENVRLVTKYADVLRPMFPEQFTENPLDAVADLLEERGMPFEETPESGGDNQIEWDPADAIIGTDEPDGGLAAR